MFPKNVFVLCIQAVFLKTALSQCTSRIAVEASHGAPLGWTAPVLVHDGLTAPVIGYDGLGWAGKGLVCDDIYPTIAPAVDFTPTSGGGLVVTSSSAIPPTGISVVSDNAFEGALSVAGEVPFVGTTGVEGLLPATGGGAINHACGDGVTSMVSESNAFVPIDASEAVISLETVAVAPTAGKINPIPVKSPAALAPRAGLGLGNKFGHHSCGNRGLKY